MVGPRVVVDRVVYTGSGDRMRRREQRDPRFDGLPMELIRFRSDDWPDFEPGVGGGVGVSGLFWKARWRYELEHDTDLPLDGQAPDAPFDPSSI